MFHAAAPQGSFIPTHHTTTAKVIPIMHLISIAAKNETDFLVYRMATIPHTIGIQHY